MHILSLMMDVVLAGYLVYEVVRFPPRYRQMKQEIAQGHAEARRRVYRQALWFEWISALLALLALGFDWNKLNPRTLGLDHAAWTGNPPGGGDFDRGAMGGVVIGLTLGMVVLIAARIRANRRGTQPTPSTRQPWWRKLFPDFSALVPTNNRERLWWAAVAVSAGICEELVFRGWLLATLRSELGLGGLGLLLAAAAIFGLAHIYQGVSGVVLTALVGAFFCVVYVKTGSLLVPILLHTAIDVRFAFLPAARVQKPEASYAGEAHFGKENNSRHAG
jgi:membrane protease YdiL (CAAX protease family)